MLLILALTWLPWLLLGSGALYLGVRVVRALERRGVANKELAELRDRVQSLEDTLAVQSQEMQRLADGVQFTERLLTERGVADRSATGSERAM